MFSLIVRISQAPHGALWDTALQRPLQFMLTALTMVGLLVPFFNRDMGTTVRTASMFSAGFLATYGMLSVTGLFDPSLPLVAFTHYVIDPIRGTYGS